MTVNEIEHILGFMRRHFLDWDGKTFFFKSAEAENVYRALDQCRTKLLLEAFKVKE